MSYVSGNVLLEEWTVIDSNNDPVTGVTTPAGIVFYLHRQSGSTMIAASETVSWSEIGVTGHYYISFTPLNTGLYVLQLEELHASSLMRWFRFAYSVVSAGAVYLPAYPNTFCAESDIERWLQQAISSSSRPNDSEAVAWAEETASILMSLCAKWGFAVTPANITAGSRLEDLLREANAIGAALKYRGSQTGGTSPTSPDSIEWLTAWWDRFVGTPDGKSKGYIELELRGNVASLSTNHILSGDTLAAPIGAAPYDIGVGPIGMGSLF